MSQVHRILVPLDSRAASLRAIEPAHRLALRLGVPLDVVSWSFAPWHERWARRRIGLHLHRHAIDRPLEVVTTQARNAGIAVAETAAERDACVVMATHARSGARRTVLGSAAEEVLSRAAAPVVLVGPRVRGWTPNGRLVTGLDRSACSERTLPHITQWARQLELPVQLVEVVEPRTPNPVGPAAGDDAYLTGVAARLPRDVTVRVTTLHGDPATVLARCASDDDLLALACHGRRGLERVVLGSVAMRVVHHARCPVIVVGARARVPTARP